MLQYILKAMHDFKQKPTILHQWLSLEIFISAEISSVRVQNQNNHKESEEQRKQDKFLNFPDVFETIGFSSLMIVAFCLLFALPWTTIPRTNSMLYQSYWMEVILPIASVHFLCAASEILNLSIWTEERTLMSFRVFFTLMFMYLVPYTSFYILSHTIWSVILQFHHPMPLSGAIVFPTLMTYTIGLWFLLPSNFLSDQKFRQKLKIYMFHPILTIISFIQGQVLLYLFNHLPPGFQFAVSFILAGVRELDKRLCSKLVINMLDEPKESLDEQNESASALILISVSSRYSLFIAIRMVQAESATICCTMIIDMLLHLKLTYRIIKDFRTFNSERNNENDTNHKNMNINKLVIAELIEGFTPIIYGACIALAYYGPNSYIISNIGNSYWSEKIDNLGPLFLTMSILFAIDLFSVAINSIWLWKVLNVNILLEFRRVLGKYWFFMAIKLAFNMATYFASNDINLGMDRTWCFEWISEEGWKNLVKNSTDITDEDKSDILSNSFLTWEDKHITGMFNVVKICSSWFIKDNTQDLIIYLKTVIIKIIIMPYFMKSLWFIVEILMKYI